MILSLVSCREIANSSAASNVQQDSLSGLDSAEKMMKDHTSENSLDWAGTYSGVLPCNNCEGIDVTLTLNNDKTFQQKIRYINSSEETDKELKGNFRWSAKGDKVKLEEVEEFSEFKVGEFFLLPLNEDGKEFKPVPGNNFQLLKE